MHSRISDETFGLAFPTEILLKLKHDKNGFGFLKPGSGFIHELRD